MKSKKDRPANSLIASAAVITLCVGLFILFNGSEAIGINETSKADREPHRLNRPTATTLTSTIRNGIEAGRRQAEQRATRQQLDDNAARLEKQRRENWVKNFPFEPTYHPTLTHDPTRYNANDPATYNRDPEMETAVKRHSFMVGFFNNPRRYCAEFESIYYLLKEIDRADNPEVMGRVFTMLRQYHRARSYDQEALFSRKHTRPYDPSSDPPDPLKRGVTEWVPVNGQTTWGDQANSYSNSIVGLLVKSKFWPHASPLNVEIAREMRDRLLTEIPSENLATMGPVVELPNGDIGVFGYIGTVQKHLKPGDPLLTPFSEH